MSVVVAIKDNDKIWMGCDSQVAYGGTKWTTKNQKKIWKPSDDENILMGGVGSLRDLNILSTTTEWIDELTKLKDEVNFKYIVRNIVPKIFKELNGFGRMRQENNIQSIESTFMFAYKNNAFEIDTDGCVVEIEDILINGSGYRIGLGAWETIKKNNELSIKEKLIEVIKACCENDLYVYYPIVIMNTNDKEINIIEK